MNKKVCLISPPSRSINHYRPPVALLYLAGYLEKNKIDTDIVDVVLDNQIRDTSFYNNLNLHLKKIEEEIIKEIIHLQPDIVGITCYTPELKEVESLAKKIKKYNSNIIVVVGGIHPTFYPEDFIYNNSYFDFAVLGEGEVTLLELVKKINDRKKWQNIKSIAYFDNSSKRMFLTEKRPLENNLDKIANPSYHKLDMDYYTTASPYAIRGVFTRSAYILSSRGCPSSCTFCVSKKIREFNGPKLCMRLRSPRHLFDEIKNLKEKYKIDAFYFIDDLFTINKKQVNDFCNLLKKSKMGLIWGCSSKVTTVDFNTLKTMKEAGCVQIDFGVERGSNEALELIKKGITVEIIKKAFFDCRKLGIRTFANMLVNLPHETEKDLVDIISLLDEIKPTIVSINVFTPYPGTEIFDNDGRNISKDDYADLRNGGAELILKNEKKYKFSDHNIDIGKWAVQNNKKYNFIFPSIAFHLSSKCIHNLLISKKKLNYVRMFNSLIKEFIQQKY